MEPADWVLGVAVLFARVSGVFLIAPGLSSLRVPVRIKLLLALGITLAIAPLLLDVTVLAVAASAGPAGLLAVLVGELVFGLAVGCFARVLFMALETMAVAIANATGLGGIPGAPIDGDEATQAAANIFMVSALAVFFLADLHYEVLRAVVDTYALVPPGTPLDPGRLLSVLAERYGDAFAVGLRLAAPFLIYAVIVNFAVGLVNKLTPNLPVFFVALPAITAGGLIMIALAIREVLIAFRNAYAASLGIL